MQVRVTDPDVQNRGYPLGDLPCRFPSNAENHEEGKLKTMKKLTALLAMCALAPILAFSQDEEAELAKKLANPVASLISVPLQLNYDSNFGPAEDGSVWRLNIQPVIPFSLNEEWNLISRTILPLIDQDDIPLNNLGESGLGDVVQSFFLSPKEPTASGWIWGAGPVLLLPTATDEMLGGEKWGAGGTAVALKQAGPWTYGALVNHIASFAGDDDRDDISATFLQPFLTYITKTKTTFALNTESTYDWKADEWSVPINFNVLQLLKIGPQIIQVGVGARYWADSPDNGPSGWGARFQLTFLFPK
jgi:hypothetical protein